MSQKGTCCIMLKKQSKDQEEIYYVFLKTRIKQIYVEEVDCIPSYDRHKEYVWAPHLIMTNLTNADIKASIRRANARPQMRRALTCQQGQAAQGMQNCHVPRTEVTIKATSEDVAAMQQQPIQNEPEEGRVQPTQQEVISESSTDDVLEEFMDWLASQMK